MADITPTQSTFGPDNFAIWTWPHLVAATPQGDVLSKNFVDYVDRSVQIEGVFDGATVVVEGSNDGVNFRSLTDPQGNAISKVAASIEQITESVLMVRPRITGGATVNTDITVTIAARKTKR